MDVLMCSYIHAYVYFTRICDLLLFLIAEWSQFLMTIFTQAQLLYLYSFNVLYQGLHFYFILSRFYFILSRFHSKTISVILCF